MTLVWGATQRPAWVPMFMVSEADKHGFWIYSSEWDHPFYVDQLTINGERRHSGEVLPTKALPR